MTFTNPLARRPVHKKQDVAVHSSAKCTKLRTFTRWQDTSCRAPRFEQLAGQLPLAKKNPYVKLRLTGLATVAIASPCSDQS